MSIRTNPVKAVPLLLRRLAAIEEHENLDDLKSALFDIKDLFSTVKKNEEELLDTLTRVDGYIRNNKRKLMEEKKDICKRIRSSAEKLLPVATIQSKKEVAESSKKEVAESSSKTVQAVETKSKENMHGAPFLDQRQNIDALKANLNRDHLNAAQLLFSLLHFPKNAVMKKKHIIYWWIGAGLVKKAQILMQGENMFNYLLGRNLISLVGNGKFKINHWIHDELVTPLLQSEEDQVCGIYSQIIASSPYHEPRHDCLALDQQKVNLSDEFGFKSNHWRAIFNVGASYLHFGPQWIARKKDLVVLHLGRWQDSVSHHIEVESEEFLKELKDQKELKYLSLRGISRISELPPSIFTLESLEILDLRACHNLEILPNDISSLKNLTHLDVSQCYLLERMPKGIEKLTNLKVLKGFVIGSSRKTPCRISDLANLEKLERLSIHIGSEAVIQEKEFESLGMFSNLKHLKISWGVSDTKRYSDIQINFPPSLEKLHLEGFPGEKIPDWFMQEPWTLEVLYITGGKLISLDRHAHLAWYNVEIVRLKYLKSLKVDLKDLQEMFPWLKYVEIKKIKNYEHIEWSRPEER